MNKFKTIFLVFVAVIAVLGVGAFAVPASSATIAKNETATSYNIVIKCATPKFDYLIYDCVNENQCTDKNTCSHYDCISSLRVVCLSGIYSLNLSYLCNHPISYATILFDDADTIDYYLVTTGDGVISQLDELPKIYFSETIADRIVKIEIYYI